jgi:hypothetical protein
MTFEVVRVRDTKRVQPLSVISFPRRVLQSLPSPELWFPPDNNVSDALFGYSTESLASRLGSGGANGDLNPLD